MKPASSVRSLLRLCLLIAFPLQIVCTISAHAQDVIDLSRRLPLSSSCEDGQRTGFPARFEIDGNLICGPGLPPGIPFAKDWYPSSPDCIGVLDPNTCRVNSSPDAPFGFFFVDPNWAIGFDPTIFRTMSNKNDDPIDPAHGWSWQGGNGYPQKNDLTEIYGTVATQFNPDTNEFENWLILGAATRASEGDEHIDFEYNTAGFQQTGSTSGNIFGLGPDGGRTAGRDFIISVDFTNGGITPNATLRLWNGTEFCVFDDAACLGNLAIPDTIYFAATNCGFVPSPCPVTDPDGLPASGYTARQFVELAINIDRLGITVDDVVNGPHLIVKTRSSQSFTAELKDFALVTFPPPCALSCPIITITPPCPLVGQTVTLSAPADPTVTYRWSCNNATTNTTTVIPSSSGPFSCDLVITSVDDPTCSIVCPVAFDVVTPPVCPTVTRSRPNPITAGQSVTLCAPTPSPGFVYKWIPPAGRAALSEPDSTCVTPEPFLSPGTFDYVLRVIRLAVGGCPPDSIDCPVPVTVVCPPAPRCEDFPVSRSRPNPINIGQSVTLCAPSPHPGFTYLWIPPAGRAALSEPDSACVTPEPFNATGTFHYTLRISSVAVGTCPSVSVDCDVPVEVTCPPASQPACPTFTATPPAKITLGESIRACFTPNGGGRRYRWEAFQGGVPFPIAEPESTCVTVTPTRAGDDIFLLQLKVMVNSDTSCFRYCPFIIDVNCPPATITCPPLTPQTITLGQSAQFCAPAPPPGVRYRWSGPFPISEPDSSCITVTPTSPGHYTFVLKSMSTIDSVACNVSCPVTLDVLCPPATTTCPPLSSQKITLGESARFCAPPAPPGVRYRWSGPFPISEPDSSCITVTPASPGHFTFVLKVMSTIDSVACNVLCPVDLDVNPQNFVCNLIPVLPDRALVCGDTASFCVELKPPAPPGAEVTYQWSVVGGQIISSPFAPCVTVKANSASELVLRAITTINHLVSDTCSITIPVGTPKCVIAAADPSRVLACGDTASFCASVIPPGGTVTYSWTITGGFIETSPTAQCVRVRAGTGAQFTLHVEIRRNNCPTSCDATIPLVPVVCEIVPIDPSRALACGDTVTYCANINPPGGLRTYQWTVTNGTIQTSPNASCIRVKLGAVGEVTIRLDATRNGCATTCSKTVSSSGLKCDVSAIAPGRTLVCGDTASFCATITPAGPNTTFQWTIEGGTIDGSSAGSCVRVIAGGGTQFTLTVSVQRNGYCPTTCSRVVALGPISCEITQLDPSRALACGDTATFCGSILPAGGARTYQWTVQGGTLLTAATASCVRVKLGSDGLMTLTLNSTRNGCALTCSKTLSTSPLKCDIVAFNPNRALACGDTASYCAVIEPAGPNTTYEWTITGGTIETSPSAQCIRVKATGGAGSFTITVTARRNLYCPTTCSLTVPVGMFKCEIVPINPNRVFACGDTATFCANIYPPGVPTSFTWTITGGVILTPSTASCVTVRFGTSGSFTLFLETSRGGKCIANCDRTFPISPLECDIVPIRPPGVLACGDTISFCASVNASGTTFSWSVVGGTLTTPATGQCITVRVTAGGELVVSLTVTKSTCTATCEERVPTVGPFCSITGESSLCAGDSATYCTPNVPNGTYSWTISGNGTLYPPTNASCVTARAGTGTGATFRLIVRVTQGTCAVSCTTDVTVRQPPTPPGGCDKCVVTYPDETHLPQSHGTVDADMVMKTFDPKTGAGLPCVVTDTLLRVFYSSDRVMLLGYRQVQVKTSSGTTTRDFPISFVPTTPTCIREPLLGDTISTGDQRYGDWYERPVFPALWITDITTSSTSRAGDFRIGLVEAVPDTGAIPPDKVCGLWKYAVRFYDKTRSGGPRATTISDFPDPAKNFWNLSSGADTPSEGFANVPNGGYGAEAAWNLTNRGLLPGHSYRLFFSVYEGGENPHPNYGCVNITIPGGGGDCPPVAPTLLAGGDGELQKPSNPQLGPQPGVDEFAGTVKVFELRQNQPNPFDHETTIHFAVPERSYVSIRVYTVTGQEVALLAGRMMEPGRQAVTWLPIDRTGRPLAPGVYMYRMTAASKSGMHAITRKMVLMK